MGSAGGWVMNCSSLCMPAAKIIGVPSRKEKRVAEVCDRLLNSPAAMVMPDRDVPGNRAMACAHPINKICLRLRRFSSLGVLLFLERWRSAMMNMRDQKNRLYPKNAGLLRLASIQLSPNKPIKPAGKDAMIMQRARWWVSGDFLGAKRPFAKPVNSFLKKIIIASRVPRCKMASRAMP